MPARKIRIGCLLAGVFVLSILDYGDAALARPAHQVSREGKSQSQSKSEKVEGVRPRASGRGTDAATSSQTPPHLDSKQNPVEPAPALANRQEGQGQRFHFPSPRHDFAAVPHPLARRDIQPRVRYSISPFHLTTSILGRRRRCQIPGRMYRRPSPSSMEQRHELEASTPGQ